MKKVVFLLFLLVPCLAYSQSINGNVQYDPVAHTLTITMTPLDVSQVWYGCDTRNYPQCTPQPYYHTGTNGIAVKNGRTGLSAADLHSATGAVVNAQVTLTGVNVGDPITISQTYTVYCPIGQAGYSNSFGDTQMEIAFTGLVPVSVASTNGNNRTWNVRHNCTGLPAGAHPDYNPSQITDTYNPAPTNWWVYALCARLPGQQPFTCQQTRQQHYFETPPTPVATCTYYGQPQQ